jgi:hypothetical protein
MQFDTSWQDVRPCGAEIPESHLTDAARRCVVTGLGFLSLPADQLGQ